MLAMVRSEPYELNELNELAELTMLYGYDCIVTGTWVVSVVLLVCGSVASLGCKVCIPAYFLGFVLAYVGVVT